MIYRNTLHVSHPELPTGLTRKAGLWWERTGLLLPSAAGSSLPALPEPQVGVGKTSAKRRLQDQTLPGLCALDQHVSKQNSDSVHSDSVSCYLFHHQVHDFCRRYFTIFSVKLFSEEMPCYPNKQSDLQRFSGPCSSLKIVLPEISHPFPVSWDFG